MLIFILKYLYKLIKLYFCSLLILFVYLKFEFFYKRQDKFKKKLI